MACCLPLTVCCWQLKANRFTYSLALLPLRLTTKDNFTLMGKSKVNRTPKRRKPLRSQKKKSTPRSYEPANSSLWSPADDSSEDQDIALLKMLAANDDISADDLPLSVVKKLLRYGRERNDFTSEQDFSEVLDNYPVGHELELMQDFQTFVKQDIAQDLQRFDENEKEEDSLIYHYYNKLAALFHDFIYVDALLQCTGLFTGDFSTYHPVRNQIQLYHDIPAIYANSVFCLPETEMIEVTMEHNVATLFAIIGKLTEPDQYGLSKAEYQQMLQEIRKRIGEFVLQRKNMLLHLNDIFLNQQLSAADLNKILPQIEAEKIKDPNHPLAQPFEAFLSEKVFNVLLCFKEQALIFPLVIKIMLKHSAVPNRVILGAILEQSCRYCETYPDDLAFRMAKIRRVRQTMTNQD